MVKKMATRAASGDIINQLATRLKSFIGGSADLGPSNKTLIKDTDDQSLATPLGRNIRFGVREHAMAAITNGMVLHGGIIPYCGTFFYFHGLYASSDAFSSFNEGTFNLCSNSR